MVLPYNFCKILNFFIWSPLIYFLININFFIWFLLIIIFAKIWIFSYGPPLYFLTKIKFFHIWSSLYLDEKICTWYTENFTGNDVQNFIGGTIWIFHLCIIWIVLDLSYENLPPDNPPLLLRKSAWRGGLSVAIGGDYIRRVILWS